jgi:hypothetical protein
MKGLIYKIVNNEDESICYIGSTSTEMMHRWGRHLLDYYKWG